MPKWEHIRTAHWLASPHHSTLSHSHQHLAQPTISCLPTIPLITSLAPSMVSPALSPLLMARLRPVLQLLVLMDIKLPNHLAPLASLASQPPPPSTSMSTTTSVVRETVSSLIPTLQKSGTGLRASPFVMRGGGHLSGIYCGGDGGSLL